LVDYRLLIVDGRKLDDCGEILDPWPLGVNQLFRDTNRLDNFRTTVQVFSLNNQQSTLAIPLYQSPQCDAVICWNFMFHASPCFTQTVLKC
jgi:hypothetical protein